MNFSEFKDKCFIAAARHGFECWELYYAKTDSLSVRVRDGEITEYKNANQSGLSFRGIYKEKMGYSFTENPHDESISVILEKAAENAKIIDSKDKELLLTKKMNYPEVNSFNQALEGIPVSEKIQIALELERIAKDTDSRVKSVDHCTVYSGMSEVCISNSFGVDVSHKSNAFCAFLKANVAENDVIKTWFDYWLGRDLTLFSPEKLARETVQTALSYLTAKTIPSGKLPVIVSPKAAIELFGAFISVFFAERVQKGFSLFKDKEGKSVANPVVTIRDDGICEKSINSMAFDSEGVPCRSKAIIANGILRTLLYNLKSAEKAKKVSTGNGFKHSFRSPVETACTNFYIEPSDISPEQMISELSNGIMITSLSGIHSGTNSITGDFSLSAYGKLIEGGTVTRPVEQIVVSGNFYELLNSIIVVGNDLHFGMPGSSGTVGMPSLLVNELTISGE